MKGRTLAALLTLLLALALVGQTVRWRNRMSASRALSNVEALTLGVASGQIPPQALAGNLEVLRRAAALDPIEVGIPIARGSQYFLLGRPEPAEEAYREALRLEPRPEAYLDLGRAQWLAGRRDEATRSFGLALRLELTIETLEDLQLALSAILDRAKEDGQVTVAMSLQGGTLETLVGPVDLSDELAGSDDDQTLSLRRILSAVVDDVQVEGDHVRLVKRVARHG